MKELRRELRIQCFNGYEDGAILLVSCCVQRMNIEIFILLFITIIENNNTITRSKIFALSWEEENKQNPVGKHKLSDWQIMQRRAKLEWWLMSSDRGQIVAAEVEKSESCRNATTDCRRSYPIRTFAIPTQSLYSQAAWHLSSSPPPLQVVLIFVKRLLPYIVQISVQF
jgi:hypothetical protein